MIRFKFFNWRLVYSWDGKTWRYIPPYPKVMLRNEPIHSPFP